MPANQSLRFKSQLWKNNLILNKTYSTLKISDLESCYIMMENSGVHYIQQTLSSMPTNVFCAYRVCENRTHQSEVQKPWSHLEVKEESSLPVSLVYYLQISSWKCCVQKSPSVLENPSNTMVMHGISNQRHSFPKIASEQFHWEPKAYKYTNQSCN